MATPGKYLTLKAIEIIRVPGKPEAVVYSLLRVHGDEASLFKTMYDCNLGKWVEVQMEVVE
jgi:hypothetical protein